MYRVGTLFHSLAGTQNPHINVSQETESLELSIIGTHYLVPFFLKVLHPLLNSIFGRGQYSLELAQQTMGIG